MLKLTRRSKNNKKNKTIKKGGSAVKESTSDKVNTVEKDNDIEKGNDNEKKTCIEDPNLNMKKRKGIIDQIGDNIVGIASTTATKAADIALDLAGLERKNRSDSENKVNQKIHDNEVNTVDFIQNSEKTKNCHFKKKLLCTLAA
jgi:hypothetical protein